jgi:hypothetical protein
MLNHAESLLGQSYIKGACENTQKGKDCTGLVYNVLNNSVPGYQSPRYTTVTLRNSGFLQKNKYNFKVGDVLLFKPTPEEIASNISTGHAAIVRDIGEDGRTISVIHSANWYDDSLPKGVQITDDIWQEQNPTTGGSYWVDQYEGYIPYEKLLIKKK